MRWGLVAGCAAVVGATTGCGSARFVQSDLTGGTVAIASNSNSWPTYYRDKAEELIRQKCPNGYEIVSEREVVTGQVAHTNAQSQDEESPTLVLAGHDDRPPNRRDPNSLGAVAVLPGETRRATQQTTTYQDVKEWRIVYRAK